MTAERTTTDIAQIPWDLPQGWKWRRVEELVEKTAQRDPKRFPDQRFTYIDIASIDNLSGAIVAGKEMFGKDAPSRARKVIREGDVIFATTRPYLRNIALVPVLYDEQICSTGFCVLRADRRNVVPSWLYYLCRSDIILIQTEARMRGVNYPAITDRDVMSASVPVPDIETQRRIVARIESLLAEVKEARTLLEEMRRDTDRITAAALISTLKILDAEFPDSPSIGDLVSAGRIELFGGSTPSKSNSEYWIGSIPWVSPKDMKRWKINDAMDHVSQTAVKESSAKLIPEGAILVVTRGMILAHTWPVAVTTSEVTINQDMKALSPKGHLLPEYLGYVLRARAPEVLRQVEIAAHGTRRLKTDKLTSVVVPDAPEEVQRSVIDHLDSVQSEVDRMRSVLDEEERLLDRLERSILEKAFRGEL